MNHCQTHFHHIIVVVFARASYVSTHLLYWKTGPAGTVCRLRVLQTEPHTFSELSVHGHKQSLTHPHYLRSCLADTECKLLILQQHLELSLLGKLEEDGLQYIYIYIRTCRAGVTASSTLHACCCFWNGTVCVDQIMFAAVASEYVLQFLYPPKELENLPDGHSVHDVAPACLWVIQVDQLDLARIIFWIWDIHTVISRECAFQAVSAAQACITEMSWFHMATNKLGSTCLQILCSISFVTRH